MSVLTTPEPPDDEPHDDDTVEEDEFAEGTTSDPDGAERNSSAGEDYAGSGF